MDEGRSPENGTGNGAQSGDDNGRKWRFSIDDLEGIQDETEREVEPGSPRLEHALFVVLGALATLFAIFRVMVA